MASSHIETAVASGSNVKRARTRSTTFDKWSTWRLAHGCSPYFTPTDDPIPWLLYFADRYRTGQFNAQGVTNLRARSIESALRFIAQAHTTLGLRDPRLDSHGHIDFRLRQQQAYHARLDPTPSRVKPLPLSVLFRAHELATSWHTAQGDALAALIWIGFFFLCRPGEFVSTEDDHPFRLEDVSLFTGETALDPLLAPLPHLSQATFAALTFSTQKNANRGEKVGHGTNDHAVANPVHALVSRVAHLRLHHAPATTPLHRYFDPTTGQWQDTTSQHMTALFRQAVLLTPQAGLTPSEVSTRSLRASGCMALLHSGVDSDTRKLLGRWRSDAMMDYLTVQSRPVMQGFSQLMLTGGDYTLIPSTEPPGVPLVP